jgi:phosphonate transport system ATP-binding protein
LSHLCLDAVSVRYSAARDAAPALRGVSLAVARGEALAVIGPSGAGKTTLLHAIACALPAASGKLSLMGQQPWTLSRHERHGLRARLFLAPQTPPLPPRQRVVTAVLAGRLPRQGLVASLRSLFHPSDIPAARDALARFDMADKLFERVDRLSGGERQRVGLARALVSQAELLLIDEPLSSLDPTRAAHAIATLRAAASESGATLVTTLHQVEVARANFERIVAMRDGELVFDLHVADVTDEMLRELYAEHEDELTSDLSGAAPWVDPVPDEVPPKPAVICR